MESKVRMEKKVIKVLKTNENIVRDAAEKKKNVMIYGLKEQVIHMRTKRKRINKMHKGNTKTIE